MGNNLQAAIKKFCQYFSPNKIYEYSYNPHDEERLTEIAYQSYISKEEVTVQNLIDGLKEHHSDSGMIPDGNIEICAQSCYDRIMQHKDVILMLDKLGHLAK